MERIKNTEDFKKFIKDVEGDNYILIGEYIKSKEKVEILHKKCNKTFFMRPNDFTQGYRCPNCFTDRRKTTDEFIKEVKELVGDEYSVIGEYVNNKKKILIRHNLCNHEFLTTPHTFLRCHGCKFCAGLAHKTTDEFIKEVKELVGDEYSVIGEYKSANIKIEMRHNKCMNNYFVTPSKFLQNRRCPVCKESKGEKIIEHFLKANNIEFISEKYFSGCKNKRMLPFDFYIKDKNLVIEYDGEQHYKPIYGSEKLEKTKENDKIKNDFCTKNNIKILRIPFWDFLRIEKILKENLL